MCNRFWPIYSFICIILIYLNFSNLVVNIGTYYHWLHNILLVFISNITILLTTWVFISLLLDFTQIANLVAYLLSFTARATNTSFYYYSCRCTYAYFCSICDHCHRSLLRSTKSASCSICKLVLHPDCGAFSGLPFFASSGKNLVCH